MKKSIDFEIKHLNNIENSCIAIMEGGPTSINVFSKMYSKNTALSNQNSMDGFGGRDVSEEDVKKMQEALADCDIVADYSKDSKWHKKTP